MENKKLIGNIEHDCNGDMPVEALPSWEEEFKQLYEVKIIDEYGSIFKQNLKHFIRRTIKTERADERMKVRDECYTWADDAVKQAGKEHQELIEFLQKEWNELAEKLKIAKEQGVREVLREIDLSLPKAENEISSSFSDRNLKFHDGLNAYRLKVKELINKLKAKCLD